MPSTASQVTQKESLPNIGADRQQLAPSKSSAPKRVIVVDGKKTVRFEAQAVKRRRCRKLKRQFP